MRTRQQAGTAQSGRRRDGLARGTQAASHRVSRRKLKAPGPAPVWAYLAAFFNRTTTSTRAISMPAGGSGRPSTSIIAPGMSISALVSSTRK